MAWNPDTRIERIKTVGRSRKTRSLDDVPEADSVAWGTCQECSRLHVMLKDRRDQPIATAVFDREMLIEMLNLLDDASQPPTGTTLQ
jgi:hypothetical protein